LTGVKLTGNTGQTHTLPIIRALGVRLIWVWCAFDTGLVRVWYRPVLGCVVQRRPGSCWRTIYSYFIRYVGRPGADANWKVYILSS